MKHGLFVAAAVALLAGASQASAAEPSRLTVGATDVSKFPDIQSTVVVTDTAGLPVSGLAGPDFTVLEDDTTVPVSSVEPITSLPANVSVTLVLDASGSMAGKPLEDAVAAINGFIDGLGPDARVGAVSLGGACQVDPGAGLDADKAATQRFVSGASPGGDTPLYDAMLVAIQQSLAAPEGRRMVVVLTDGEDTCSKVSLNTVVAAAVHNSVPLTVVGLGPDIQPDALQNLATLTGGQYLSVEDSTKLAAIYADLARRLRTQYTITYRSAQLADHREHRLTIRVRSGTAEASAESRFTPPDLQPTLQLSVQPGQKIAEPTPVEITSSAPVQLTRADLFLDDTLLDSVSKPALSYTLDPSGLSVGKHTLRVHAWDSAGGQAETSTQLEFVDTGLFGHIPFWAILAVVLVLPVVVLVGTFALNEQRSLRCPKCRRTIQSTWTTCPYCPHPEQGVDGAATGGAAACS
jgi:VWFA-related protein